jgi:hypothetical protein
VSSAASEATLAALSDAVASNRRLATTRPDALPDLAASLVQLVRYLTNLGRQAEALAASAEAVALYRRLAETGSDELAEPFVAILNHHATILADLSRQEESIVALREAVGVCRAMPEAGPGDEPPLLAVSLDHLAWQYFGLARYEAALVASREVVGIYRRLAEARPDAALPDLARSLNVVALSLSHLRRHREAAVAASEGLVIVAPFLEARGPAFESVVDGLAGQYLASCESAGIPADDALLARIAQAMRPDGPEPDEATIDALRAAVTEIVKDAANTGVLEEAALARLPAELADMVRAAWVRKNG